ncbi:MAG TPA: NAD-dependent epimerase/dehydratase family protein [Streptosporangiaceae bacterium]|nr:NAD-dependent epimerase/dehydratase family protein [Streptosporangiaceae bacterium]
MERVLVTGVAGFIGSHLAEGLLGRGVAVTGVDSRSPASDPGAAENLAGLVGRDDFHLVVADLVTADLTPLLEDVPVVFHLAAMAGVRRSWGDRFADYLACNVIATQRLLEACAAAEVPRLVAASSSSVYGHASTGPSREDDPLAPASPYGVTKLAAERLCAAYATRRQASTSVVALRYFTVYGPRQRPDMAISRILRAAISGRGVPLYGDGRQRRDFTYVSDAVAATMAAATADTQMAVVNVGSGRSTTLKEVLDLVAAITGGAVPVLHRLDQPGDVEVTAADLTRAQELLGYQPSTDLAAGLRQQWTWLTSRHHSSAHLTADVAGQ